MEKVLEELYLSVLSAKGFKNSLTVKTLINYVIALTIYNPHKCDKVLDFIRDSQGSLPNYLLFFDAINDIIVKR